MKMTIQFMVRKNNPSKGKTINSLNPLKNISEITARIKEKIKPSTTVEKNTLAIRLGNGSSTHLARIMYKRYKCERVIPRIKVVINNFRRSVLNESNKKPLIADNNK